VLPLLDAYRRPEKPLLGAPAPTEVFRGAVQEAKINTDKDIPHLSATLIDKYVSDLQFAGPGLETPAVRCGGKPLNRSAIHC
jgi:fatty acid CoA ligase FadD9